VIFTQFTTAFSASRLALDIAGGKTNGEIIMWPDHGGRNQKWHFEEDMTIRSELGTVLDVKGGSSENRAPLLAFSKHGGDNQKFRVVPISEG
jgi:hypothetical protein